MSTLVQLDETTFVRLYDEKTVAFVLWYAHWCAPCKVAMPIVEKVAADYGDVVLFAEIDVDKSQQLVNNSGIMSVPTFQLWKGGAVVKQWCGVSQQFEQELRDKIEQVLEG